MRNILIYSACLFLIGCINPFAPKLAERTSDEITILTSQKTPLDVLTNFRYAYVFKDSLIYSDLLDTSFIFISKNYNTNPPTDIIWGRDTELKTTQGLFRHFDVLELTWGEVLSAPQDTSEIKITFQLTLDGGRDFPTVKGEAIFNFRLLSDSTWQITRWEDLSNF